MAAPLKLKGDIAELAVAKDLRARGFGVAFPFGEDNDYDLIVDRRGVLERVQVKHVRSDGQVIVVHCRSISVTNGRVTAEKRYTAETVDWLAVYDPTTDRCYYIPAVELGAGRATMSLRLTPALSGRRQGVHLTADYLEL